MTKLATKLACATLCLLLLSAVSRTEAADQQASLTDQQVARVRELINDAIQSSLDAVNRRIDSLFGAIQANHLKAERRAQEERTADYKTGNDDEQSNDEHESNYNNGEHEHKYVERRYIYICCRSHWYHCCRPPCDL